MLCHGVWLLVVAALLAHVGASSATSASQPITTDMKHAVPLLSTIVSQRHLRQLRVHKLTNHDDDERGITVPGLEAVANSVKFTVSVEKLREWAKRGESADDVFKLLTLDKAADDLLANPNLNAWINYIKLFNEENPTKKVSLVATLTAKYGDDGLAKLIEAAKKVPSTEGIAKQVQAEQLQSWLTDKKTTKEVFALLALDKAGDDLLASPLLNTWLSYMKLVNENNPAKKSSLLATLTAHYGADGMDKMIESAKRVPSTATTAKRLESEQIRRWIADEMYPIDVFTLLKLDKSGPQLFTQPQVNTWIKFVDNFEKANPNTEKTLFSVLQKRYDEPTLVQMLIKAKNIPSLESVAVRIQAEQTKFWLGVDVKTAKEPAKVFALLRINDKDGVELLSNPLFIAWIKYTDEFNRKYFGTRKTAIPALLKHYKADDLAKMILAGSKNPSTARLAKRMYDELLRSWSVEKLAPVLVFSSLNLHQSGNRLLEQPLFTVWLKYLIAYSDKNPKANVNLLSQLENIYKGDRLSKLLIAAEKVPSTKKLATDLISKQLEGWLSSRKDPVEVFYLLGVQGTSKNGVPNLLYQKYNAAFKRLKK